LSLFFQTLNIFTYNAKGEVINVEIEPHIRYSPI
jgi:hypothetical protein